uniref:Reverse transcriptase zinc-binding domain-containing protein n=1 Tax=Brassica oleracea var. oleracea TaxID=109376 RepID=A0A0D3B9D7_BRAOL
VRRCKEHKAPTPTNTIGIANPDVTRSSLWPACSKPTIDPSTANRRPTRANLGGIPRPRTPRSHKNPDSQVSLRQAPPQPRRRTRLGYRAQTLTSTGQEKLPCLRGVCPGEPPSPKQSRRQLEAPTATAQKENPSPDGCPTRDRILSWEMQTDPKCLYCNVGDESITHCFFECNFTWEIWNIIAAKCGFSSSRQWQPLLLQFQQHPPNKVLKTLLLLCWQATLYTLWTERNNRLHNAHFSSSDELWQPLLLQFQQHPPNKVLKTLLLLCWQATLYTLWTERNNRLHNAHFSSSDELVRQIKLTVKNRGSSLRIDRPKFSSSLLQLWFAT